MTSRETEHLREELVDAVTGSHHEFPTDPPGPPVLELDDVHAGYQQFHALFGVTLHVSPGEAVALIGPNGVGKTTVARVATGLVAPTAGHVRIDGADLTGRPAQVFARSGIAHAPEGRSVFATLTVEENLLLPFTRQFGRSGQAAALDRAIDLFPALARRRKQSAGSLSGGEQRMLTLARSLVLEPRLLVADELSLGLAPIITNEVYETLERILGSGTALLVIEQQIDHALALADRVVVLHRGIVTFDGAPADAGDDITAFLHKESGLVGDDGGGLTVDAPPVPEGAT
jgi:branched-chain amino acid transport system ATP-binding protein